MTSWLRVSPFFSVNQESPFLLVALPAVLQPAGPALAGFFVISSVFGLKPCQIATARQMCFGVKQFFRAFGVFGSEPLVTSEKVCGPTCFGFVSLTISSWSPTVTDSGPTNFSFPLVSSISTFWVTPVGVAAVAIPEPTRTRTAVEAARAATRRRARRESLLCKACLSLSAC
ncbi:MAG: hypothetical protein QOF06_1057 [Solirubrobacterales bacterium]|nr:hypothetical protein [Solirubrobacterales bacterium]